MLTLSSETATIGMENYEGEPVFLDEPEEVLIPGLPNDLAIQCLVRIPRGPDLVTSIQVSKAWMRKIKSQEFADTKRTLGIFEDWPFVLLQGRENGRIWRALDAVRLMWHTLPEAPVEEVFHGADKECFVAGRKLLVVGVKARMSEGYEIITSQMIWMYSVDQNTWEVAPPMGVERCLFASASEGDFGYVAGGSVYGTNGRLVSKAAERFNSLSNQWERLPDMHFARKECSGFIMDGCFYVIGGIDGPDFSSIRHDSGEYYNPRSGVWTLVPNFWPAVLRRQNVPVAPPLVAVLANQLYALDAASNELKHYNKSTGVWRSLIPVPNRAHHETGWGLGFKAVEQELWVIGGRSPTGQPVGAIDACKPDPSGVRPTMWRQVTGTFNGDGFCLNCAVMKI